MRAGFSAGSSRHRSFHANIDCGREFSSRRRVGLAAALIGSLALAACSEGPTAMAPALSASTSGTALFTEKAGTAPVYRFAKISNGAYFYTGNVAERDLILAGYPDFRYEGVAFASVTDGAGKPVYRFANLANGGYFYTGSIAERDLVIRDYPNMRFEGSTFSVAQDSAADALPVLRLANLANGAYLFTTSRPECEYAVSLGSWRYEGSTFRVPAGQPVADPFTPPAPAPLASAATTFEIDAQGIGGDGGGDGGAAGGAGDGAPIGNALVLLIDAQGRFVQGLTDRNGRYLLRFRTAEFSPPYIIKVIDSGGRVLASTLTDRIAANRVVWANVNPLTDKVVSDSLAAGVSGTDKSFVGAAVDAAKVPARKQDLVSSVDAALRSLCIADTSQFDPIRSAYSYDGKGVDAVLDSIDHTRAPVSGATELRAKLDGLTTSAGGTEQPTLVSASTPLNTGSVAVSTSPALTFSKLNAWVAEWNRCLALGGAYSSDAACVDSDGSRLVSRGYRANGADFHEDFRTLFSESGDLPVVGSSLRNPVVLFYERGATPANGDLATVEFTVLQPRVGPLGPNGAVASPVEYPRIVVFRRDDSLNRSKAGNWIAFGNQRRYNLSAQPRYFFFNQSNPAQTANVFPQHPSFIKSSLQFMISRKRYDVASRSRVDANIRVVRVKGPGLPAAGIVLGPSTVCGASDYLTIFAKDGRIPTSAVRSQSPYVDFRLNSVTASGGPLFYANSDYSSVPEEAYPRVTDFSPLRAYSLYSFEIFLNSNSTGIADAVEFARTYAPVLAPEKLVSLPRNGLDPSASLVTAPAAGLAAGGSFTIGWTVTPDAAPVERVSIYAIPSNGTSPFNVGAPVPAAFSLNSRPNSQVVPIPSVAEDPNCTAGLPALGTGASGGYREVILRSTQGRALVYNDRAWTNP